MSDRTIANRHSHVTAFLRFCKLDVKALAPIKPKYEKTLPEIYTTEEMRVFLRIPHERLSPRHVWPGADVWT